MRGHLAILTALAAALASGANGETLAFPGGTCTDDGKGGYSIEIGGKRLDVAALWIDPRWGQSVIRGGLAASVAEGKLRLTLAATAGKGKNLNRQHPMMVRLSGNAADYLKERMRLGNLEKTFEKEAWAWGDRFAFVPHQMEVVLSRAASVNYLIDKKGDWSLRIFYGARPTGDGGGLYAGTLDFAAKKVVIAPPVDVIAQKREQYGRVLMPPQEKGFDPTRWREAIAAPSATAKTFGLIEDLFDARSRLYSAAERLAYKTEEDAAGARLVAAGYEALNAMDCARAVEACAAIEARLAGSEKWMPYGAFNPFNWVKCFTQWGYRRAADGCSVAEPNPWLLEWQDGFRCSIAQDERVAIVRGKGEEAACETRYLKPMGDVSFERSWVSTVWNLPGRRITFSLLSPIVDVEGGETLTLAGFSSPPRVLRCPNERGQVTCVTLAEGGERPIDAAHLIGPYFTVSGKGWALAFFPTARPQAVRWAKGALTVRFERAGRVGMMRLRDNLHACEQPAICEFFARAYLAYPTACRSTVEGGRVRWRYTYRTCTNAWGTAAHVVAPVPPLADYAGAVTAGAKTVKYPTKWGLFRYCEGKEAVCDLPGDLPREPRLRGVNVALDDSDANWEAHVTNGAAWVRVYFGGKRTLAEQCALIEAKLRRYGSRVKFLVDPHRHGYEVDWGGGANPDPAVEGKFYEVWEEVAKVGAKYPEAIAGYDLYNEPGLTAGGEARWRRINEKAAAIIHAHHPNAKIYYSAVYGGNPNGLFNLEPPQTEGSPLAVTYHFYAPHAFTHQKCATHNRGGDTCVFYPAWSAPIDWAAGNHFGGTTVDWYDRWTLAAILLPAYEHYAEWRVPQHVGELGVIGYANTKSPRSAFLWTRDAIELIEANGASWQIWNGGFGLGNALVRPYVYHLWQER